MASAVLLLSCPDRRGIVAEVANFILAHDGNVLHADQHVDRLDGVFFQRVEFDLDSFALDRDDIWPAFAPIAERFAMAAVLRFSDDRTPTAILASRSARKNKTGSIMTRRSDDEHVNETFQNGQSVRIFPWKSPH